jgi:hypothetical protein
MTCFYAISYEMASVDHGLQVGDVIWRSNLPTVYTNPNSVYIANVPTLGPVEDTGTPPVQSADPAAYALFLDLHKVRYVNGTTVQTYGYVTFTEAHKVAGHVFQSMVGLQHMTVTGHIQKLLGTIPPSGYVDRFDASTNDISYSLIPPLQPRIPLMYDGNHFLATAISPIDLPSNENCRLMRSTTGTSGWTADPNSKGYFEKIINASGQYVGMSGTPGFFYSSVDNFVTWVPHAISTYPLHNFVGGIQYRHVRYLNGEFVAVGDQSMIIHSPTASSWQEIPLQYFYPALPQPILKDIDYQGGYYLIIGMNNRTNKSTIFRGPTLQSLITVPFPNENVGDIHPYGSPPFVMLQAMVYHAGRYVVVGCKPSIDTSLYQPLMMTSTDNGMTWTDVSFSGTAYLQGYESYFQDVVYCNGTYIATGPNCTGTSPDGVTWTENVMLGLQFTDLVTNGSITLAQTFECVAYTSDGSTWHDSPTP